MATSTTRAIHRAVRVHRRCLRRPPAVHHTSITGAIDAARRLRSGTTPPYATHSMDKLARVQDEINEATDVMRQNIEQVVGRGEHLELLVDKSEGFSANARAFQKQSGALRHAMWWKNVKMILTLSGIVLALVLVVLHAKCGWLMRKCRASGE